MHRILFLIASFSEISDNLKHFFKKGENLRKIHIQKRKRKIFPKKVLSSKKGGKRNRWSRDAWKFSRTGKNSDDGNKVKKEMEKGGWSPTKVRNDLLRRLIGFGGGQPQRAKW